MIEINATPFKKPVEQILNSKTINISNQKEKHRRNDFYVSIQKNKNKIFLNIKIPKKYNILFCRTTGDTDFIETIYKIYQNNEKNGILVELSDNSKTEKPIKAY